MASCIRQLFSWKCFTLPLVHKAASEDYRTPPLEWEKLKVVIFASEQFKNYNGKGKLYFNWCDGSCTLLRAQPLSGQRNITLLTRKSGHRYLKSYHPFAKGREKTAYLDYDLEKKEDIVRTVQTARDDSFSCESPTLKQLKDSPYVVRCYEQKTNRDKQIFRFHYCAERTLSDCINAGLRKQSALLIFHDVLLALTQLHEIGVVHLDLHMCNIFVERDRGILADFGASRKLSDLNDPKSFKQIIFESNWNANGVLFAPELLDHMRYTQYRGERPQPLTGLVDIWSLGVLMASCIYDFEMERGKTLTYYEQFPCFLRVFYPIACRKKTPRKMEEAEIKAHVLEYCREHPEPEPGTIDHLLFRMTHYDFYRRPTPTEAVELLEQFL